METTWQEAVLLLQRFQMPTLRIFSSSYSLLPPSSTPIKRKISSAGKIHYHTIFHLPEPSDSRCIVGMNMIGCCVAVVTISQPSCAGRQNGSAEEHMCMILERGSSRSSRSCDDCVDAEMVSTQLGAAGREFDDARAVSQFPSFQPCCSHV